MLQNLITFLHGLLCFSIVALVEALIAGWDIAEALRRAEAYRLAGADAILIHSKTGRFRRG